MLVAYSRSEDFNGYVIVKTITPRANARSEKISVTDCVITPIPIRCVLYNARIRPPTYSVGQQTGTRTSAGGTDVLTLTMQSERVFDG